MTKAIAMMMTMITHLNFLFSLMLFNFFFSSSLRICTFLFTYFIVFISLTWSLLSYIFQHRPSAVPRSSIISSFCLYSLLFFLNSCAARQQSCELVCCYCCMLQSHSKSRLFLLLLGDSLAHSLSICC